MTVSTLKEDLASLKIDTSERGGGGRKGLWIGLVLLVAAAGTAWWFWTTRLQAATVKVATVTAKSGAASGAGSVLNASGYVTARRRATVSSKVTGKVLEIFVEEGQSVRQGQVLARLDDSQARAALSLAEAQLAASRKSYAEDEARLREAELTFERRERLMKEGVVGKAEVDTARAETEAVRARIAYAREQILVAEQQVNVRRTDLADMVVRAPFSGVAISKDAQPGEMISPVSAGGGFTRTGIGTIVDMSSLEVEVDVNESFINRVKPGMKVESVLDAYPDWRIPSHVITTVPSADRQKATVRVRIGFDESVRPGSAAGQAKAQGFDPRILPDMGVKVSFLREEEPAKAAVAPAARFEVPKAAVRSVDGRTIVFVVRDDHLERRAVRTGNEDGDAMEVLSGVTAGERVVIEGPPTLQDGDRVRIQG
jgi:RND family efflux transporter MFP subunit